jgi:hypothetical protein
MVLPLSTPFRVTATGTEDRMVVFVPNSPESFLPQAARVPSAHSARL